MVDTRQEIGLGATANDGNGDSLRTAGQKINTNFATIFSRIGGDNDNIGGNVYNNTIVTTAGTTVSTDHTLIIGNKTVTGNLTLTLGSGTSIGEYKIFVNRGSQNMVITPSNFAQGSTVTLNQYDACQMIWDGTRWYLIGNQSQVTVV